MHTVPEGSSKKELPHRRTALKVAIASGIAATAGGLAYLLGTRENDSVSHHEHPEHLGEEAKNAAWEAQEEQYRTLRRLEDRTPLIDVYDRVALREAFLEGLDLVICCMDERVQVHAGQKKIAIAGSGILLNEEQLTLFIARMRETGRVLRVTSHEGCGACAMFCERMGLPTARAEQEGQNFAARLVERLGLPAMALGRSGYPHSGRSQPDFLMEGDPHFHHARNIVIDFTGNFRPTVLGFPASFELSAKHYPGIDHVLTEFRAAVGIAFGDHGFGAERYRGQGRKLLVTVVHDSRSPTGQRFLVELQTLLAGDLLSVMHNPSQEDWARYAGKKLEECISIIEVEAPSR